MLFPRFLLDDLLHDSFVPADNRAKVNKTDTGYSVVIALPGVKSENISVELDPVNNTIIVEIEKGSEFVSSLKKVYELPQSVDIDAIETSVDLGVLTINIPFKSDSARRKLM